MAIPSFDLCLHPLLRVLSRHPEGLRTREAQDATAEEMGLSEEDRRLMLDSGNELVYRNRIAWAQHHLKAANLTEAPRWGVWKATQAGLDLLNSNSDGFDEDTRKKVLEPGYKPKGDSEGVDKTPTPVPPHPRSPEEQIQDASRQLDAKVAEEVLDLLMKGTSEFFERTVLDVLHAMGYGADRGSVHHTGRSGDGGIDGVIALDRLGLQKIYVQAKRWKNSVGRPEVQGMVGAMQPKGAQHGLVMTTGTFTPDAKAYAKEVGEKVVLVDGAKLAKLMVEHGVGVTHSYVRIPKVDRDYFEEG